MARRKQELSIGTIALLGILAVVIGFFLKKDKQTSESPPVSIPTPVEGIDLPRSEHTIRIASFNIQHFSGKKLARPDVLKVLARTAAQFDVLAIQEIRDKDQSLIERFVKEIRKHGRDFDYEVGPRLGRTVSKEQFVFLWDKRRITLLSTPPPHTAQDPGPGDALHREPFVARFQVKTTQGTPFSFALANLHTDPDESREEVVALHRVYHTLKRQLADIGEDDVILLGDFNERIGDFYEPNGKRRGLLSGTGLSIRNANWLVTGKTGTMARGSKQNDNFLFSQSATAEYTGRWGVYDFRKAFGLEQKPALKVSDHLPIWGEFVVREQ